MNTRQRLGTALLGLAAFSVHAQTTLPGLWEVTQKMGGNPEIDNAMADMQKELAGMPPAQRKQMEAMLGGQGMGVPGAAAGGGTVIKTCISKDMADRSQMPMQKGDCTSTVLEKTRTSMKMKFACTSPPSSGEGQFTFLGDKAYTMKMTINALAQGKPQTTTLEGSGKWLGADCGAIKPMGAPKN